MQKSDIPTWSISIFFVIICIMASMGIAGTHDSSLFFKIVAIGIMSFFAGMVVYFTISLHRL